MNKKIISEKSKNQSGNINTEKLAFCTQLGSTAKITNGYQFALELFLAEIDCGTPCITDGMLIDSSAFHVKIDDGKFRDIIENKFACGSPVCLSRFGERGRFTAAFGKLLTQKKDLACLTEDQKTKLIARLIENGIEEKTNDNQQEDEQNRALKIFKETLGDFAIRHLDVLNWYDEKITQVIPWPKYKGVLARNVHNYLDQACQQGVDSNILNNKQVIAFRHKLEQVRDDISKKRCDDFSRQEMWKEFNVENIKGINKCNPSVQLILNYINTAYLWNFPNAMKMRTDFNKLIHPKVFQNNEQDQVQRLLAYAAFAPSRGLPNSPFANHPDECRALMSAMDEYLVQKEDQNNTKKKNTLLDFASDTWEQTEQQINKHHSEVIGFCEEKVSSSLGRNWPISGIDQENYCFYGSGIGALAGFALSKTPQEALVYSGTGKNLGELAGKTLYRIQEHAIIPLWGYGVRLRAKHKAREWLSNLFPLYCELRKNWSSPG